jgi:hypothetical protein
MKFLGDLQSKFWQRLSCSALLLKALTPFQNKNNREKSENLCELYEVCK